MFVLLCLVTSIVYGYLFYIGFDKNHKNHVKAWFSWLFYLAIINFAITFAVIKFNAFEITESLYGGLGSFVISTVFFVVVSFITKNFSKNNIYTPCKFPTK